VTTLHPAWGVRSRFRDRRASDRRATSASDEQRWRRSSYTPPTGIAQELPVGDTAAARAGSRQRLSLSQRLHPGRQPFASETTSAPSRFPDARRSMRSRISARDAPSVERGAELARQAPTTRGRGGAVRLARPSCGAEVSPLVRSDEVEAVPLLKAVVGRAADRELAGRCFPPQCSGPRYERRPGAALFGPPPRLRPRPVSRNPLTIVCPPRPPFSGAHSRGPSGP
jgi:hypothetical protein